MSQILTTSVREREDLSEVVDILLLKDDDMKFLSMIRFLPRIRDIFAKKVTAQKHEWLDDAARAVTVAAIASADATDWDTTDDITDLPVVTAEITKLRVGDVLLLPLGDEVVIVSSIDVAAQTIDLIARGHGSTTATVQGEAAFSMTIIGNAQSEGADPLTADFTTQTAGFNYTQIFEDVAQITGTVRRSKTVGGDHLDFQIVKKIKESLKSLNKALIEGIKDLDTTNNIGTMGGLREFITNTSDVSGALTLAKLYTAVISHIDAGLVPHAIHASSTVIGDIEQLYVGNVRQRTSENKVGLSVNVVSMMGHDVELHADRDIRSAEALILDYNRCGFDYLDGGTKDENGDFAVYKLLDKENGKQHAAQVLGEWTMRVSNGGGTRMFGIT